MLMPMGLPIAVRSHHTPSDANCPVTKYRPAIWDERRMRKGRSVRNENCWPHRVVGLVTLIVESWIGAMWPFLFEIQGRRWTGPLVVPGWIGPSVASRKRETEKGSIDSIATRCIAASYLHLRQSRLYVESMSR